MYVWLKYTSGATTAARRYNALGAPTREERDAELRRTLAGTDIENLMSRRRDYELSIGADELAVPAAYEHLIAWHAGPQRWIAFSASATEPAAETFIAVTVPPGAMPIELEGGNRHLPNYATTVIEKRPRP